MATKVYTAQEMRDAADLREAWGDKDEVNNMLRQAADALEREEKRFIIRSNDDGSVWVSPHRWLKGHCSKATVFSSAFYAKQAVRFEEKSKSGREQLPQVYEIMDDGRLRLVSDEECAK